MNTVNPAIMGAQEMDQDMSDVTLDSCSDSTKFDRQMSHIFKTILHKEAQTIIRTNNSSVRSTTRLKLNKNCINTFGNIP